MDGKKKLEELVARADRREFEDNYAPAQRSIAIGHDSIRSISDAYKAMEAERDEALAERNLLQDVLDSRPAINAGLPESYIRWSQSIYSGDAIRVVLKGDSRHEG